MCPPLFAAALPATPAAVTLVGALVLIAAAAYAGGSSVALASLGHRPMQVLLSATGGGSLGCPHGCRGPPAWWLRGIERGDAGRADERKFARVDAAPGAPRSRRGAWAPSGARVAAAGPGALDGLKPAGV